METLKYTIIKNKEQYNSYCNTLEGLITLDDHSTQDEIELLTLLIEKWDDENNSLKNLSPIELLNELMIEHHLKAKDLVDILGLSKGTVSKILNCSKGLSKEVIRKLSDYFKVSQETFNRPYKLTNEANRPFRNNSMIRTKKNMVDAY